MLRPWSYFGTPADVTATLLSLLNFQVLLQSRKNTAHWTILVAVTEYWKQIYFQWSNITTTFLLVILEQRIP